MTDRDERPLERCTICGEGVLEVPRFVCGVCRESLESEQNYWDAQAEDADCPWGDTA